MGKAAKARAKDKDWEDRLSLVEPDDQNQPGSIEQHLDMVERRGPRSDDILRDKGGGFDENAEFTEESMLHNYHIDMADVGREGDEMSGDEHSLGLQGGDSEFENQPTFEDGLPGEETKREERREKRGLPEE